MKHFLEKFLVYLCYMHHPNLPFDLCGLCPLGSGHWYPCMYLLVCLWGLGYWLWTAMRMETPKMTLRSTDPPLLNRAKMVHVYNMKEWMRCTHCRMDRLNDLLQFHSLFHTVLGSNSVKEPSWTALPEEDSGSEEGYLSPCSSPNLDCRSSVPKSTHRALLSGAALLASVALGRHLQPQHPPTPPPRTAHRTNVPALELGREHPPLAVVDLPTDPILVGDLITFSTDTLPQELLDASLKPLENKPLPLTPPPPNPRERDRSSRKTVQHSSAEWIANGETESESMNQTGDRRRRSSQGLSSQLSKILFLRRHYWLTLLSI